MKSRIRIYGIAALSLIVLALGYYMLFTGKKNGFRLSTELPVRGDISQYVTATGKIEPMDTVSVGTQISGIIKNVYADFNSKVRKGQLIAELDKSLLQATLDQDKGNLLNAESHLVFQRSNFERQNLLFKAEAISKADYDSALDLFTEAKANLASARAQVRLATKNLSYADIYSPIDGVVLFRNISPGQTVAASFNTPTLFILAKDIKKMEVEADVDEADIGGVKRGNRAAFTVDAFLNDQFRGKVTDIRLHPRVSANVVTYTTIIDAPNDEMKLKPGMTANITVYTREVSRALLISSKALTFTPDTIVKQHFKLLRPAAAKPRDSSSANGQLAAVWVVRGDLLIHKTIRTGINDNTHVQVLDGLTAIDRVVLGVASGNGSGPSAATGGSPFLPRRSTGGGRPR